MARRKTGDAFVESERRREVAPEEETDVAGRLGRGVDAAAGKQCLDLGSEAESLAVIGVVQGLDAKGIAGDEKSLFAVVPDGKGIHAAEFVQHRFALEFVKVKEDLGVALGNEAAAFGFELGTELAVVVDLAVEGDDEGAVVAEHRLGAGRGEIDNRKAAMAKADTTVLGEPIAGAVRTASGHGVADGGELGGADGFAGAVVKDGSDAAHSKKKLKR